MSLWEGAWLKTRQCPCGLPDLGIVGLMGLGTVLCGPGLPRLPRSSLSIGEQGLFRGSHSPDCTPEGRLRLWGPARRPQRAAGAVRAARRLCGSSARRAGVPGPRLISSG